MAHTANARRSAPNTLKVAASGNDLSADGHVVDKQYGCGAHSDTPAPAGTGSPAYEPFDDGVLDVTAKPPAPAPEPPEPPTEAPEPEAAAPEPTEPEAAAPEPLEPEAAATEPTEPAPEPAEPAD